MGLFSATKPLAGLDIGSSSVKLVQLRESGKGFRLVTLGVRPLPQEAIVDGAVIDGGIIADTIRDLVKETRLRVKDVAISVSGHSVIIKKIKVPAMSEEELEQNIQFEAEQYVPFDPSEVNMDFVILGDSGEEGKMDVLLVVVKKDIINDLTNVVRDAGLNPVVVDVDVFALENMYETNYMLAPDEVVALVNVGAAVTNINIIRDGLSIFTRDVSMGGNQFTEAIQKQLSVSFDEAEALKRGEAVAGKNADDVAGILKGIAGNLASEVQRSLDFFYSSSPEVRINRVSLSGGGAKAPGLVPAIEERLNIQVEMVNPLASIAYNRKKFDEAYIGQVGPSLGIGVGLAIRKVGDR